MTAELAARAGGPAECAISAATHAIYQALRDGTWIPGQRQRLQQLTPGTRDQALAGVLGGSPGRQDDDPGQAIVEIAIYLTLSGSPHAASGRTAPATAPRPNGFRSPLIAVAAAGLLSPEGFSRRRPQPGHRSGDDQG
jgi:hypothetical protein